MSLLKNGNVSARICIEYRQFAAGWIDICAFPWFIKSRSVSLSIKLHSFGDVWGDGGNGHAVVCGAIVITSDFKDIFPLSNMKQLRSDQHSTLILH